MNRTSPTDDALDQLLGSFFKAQIPQPWPNAPATGTLSEPAILVAKRAESRQQQPIANRDHSRKARYTLAASVAILLGTCWTLSNGLPAGNRPANGTSSGAISTDVVGPSNAKTPEEIRDALKDDMFRKSK